MKCNPALLLLVSIPAFLLGCASAKHKNNITSQTYISQLEDSLAGGHLGICIYDPKADKYLVEYNDRKYFTPASNMKLFTCYAAMKYLGDSLVGLRYSTSKTLLLIEPSADPTFMHPDFSTQKVLDFLQSSKSKFWAYNYNKMFAKPYGKGWSWDDFQEPYMVERSAFPVNGNLVYWKLRNVGINYTDSFHVIVNDSSILTSSLFNFDGNISMEIPYTDFSARDNDSGQAKLEYKFNEKRVLSDSFKLTRDWQTNMYNVIGADNPFKNQLLPAHIDDQSINNFLESVFKKRITNRLNYEFTSDKKDSIDIYVVGELCPVGGTIPALKPIHSQPTDSLLKPMMHRSDNFFAEQTLLMVSNEKLGYMSDDKIIDTLLKTDLKDIPDKPVWVDGSGLSRYNLVTPRDFVWLLNKIKTEFPFERIKNILPTGGEGTLLHYYNQDSGFIYAKTGTLGGQVSISGYLITQTGRILTFSILVSNHNGSASAIRRQVEEYLSAIRRKY